MNVIVDIFICQHIRMQGSLILWCHWWVLRKKAILPPSSPSATPFSSSFIFSEIPQIPGSICKCWNGFWTRTPVVWLSHELAVNCIFVWLDDLIFLSTWLYLSGICTYVGVCPSSVNASNPPLLSKCFYTAICVEIPTKY